MNEQQIAEAVILVRQGSRTLAVHVPNLLLILSPIIDEPDFRMAPIYFLPPTTVTGYEVEAHGVADRITLWVGSDPFERSELVEGQAAIDG